MFDQVMSAVIDACLSIPPVRFAMGLAAPVWPLWATLWLAGLSYILFRTQNHPAARGGPLHLLSEASGPRQPGRRQGTNSGGTDPAPTSGGSSESDQPPPGAEVPLAQRAVPVSVLAVAIAGGLVAVLLVALFMWRQPTAPPTSGTAARAESTQVADTALDVRWQSSRMDGADCVATFLVAHGPGSPSRFDAFVMDSTKAVMARDSVQVPATTPGALVELRFRRVDCNAVKDWQLQTTTPRPAAR